MNATELLAAARRLSIRSARPGDSDIVVQYILATVHEDDDEPVTVEWFDPLSTTGNQSTTRYLRIYEIIPSVRLVAEAKAGGFHPCELWIGSEAAFTRRKVTRGQVRRLLSALGIEVTKGTYRV